MGRLPTLFPKPLRINVNLGWKARAQVRPQSLIIPAESNFDKSHWLFSFAVLVHDDVFVCEV